MLGIVQALISLLHRRLAKPEPHLLQVSSAPKLESLTIGPRSGFRAEVHGMIEFRP